MSGTELSPNYNTPYQNQPSSSTYKVDINLAKMNFPDSPYMMIDELQKQ